MHRASFRSRAGFTLLELLIVLVVLVALGGVGIAVTAARRDEAIFRESAFQIEAAVVLARADAQRFSDVRELVVLTSARGVRTLMIREPGRGDRERSFAEAGAGEGAAASEWASLDRSFGALDGEIVPEQRVSQPGAGAVGTLADRVRIAASPPAEYLEEDSDDAFEFDAMPDLESLPGVDPGRMPVEAIVIAVALPDGRVVTGDGMYIVVSSDLVGRITIDPISGRVDIVRLRKPGDEPLDEPDFGPDGVSGDREESAPPESAAPVRGAGP